MACGTEPAPPGAGSALILVDDAGDTTRLAAPAARIVSLSPSVTELLFALGAGPAVVGRTTWDDHPPAAREVSSVGDGLAPNLEAILAREPGLVVLYASPSNHAAATRLRDAGVPSVQLRVDNLDDWARAARLLGRATGHARRGDSLATAVLTSVAAASVTPRDPLRVAVVVGTRPPIVIGAGSFLADLVAAAGGRNAFDDIAAASAPVSLELLAVRDPDLLITLGAEPPGALAQPEWQAVRAVRAGRVIALEGSAWAWPGPRTPEAVRDLAARLAAVGP